MEEKDITNPSEFEEGKEENNQQDNSMFSFGEQEVTDGLEDFDGLLDEVPQVEENFEETSEQSIEQTVDEPNAEQTNETVESFEQPIEKTDEEFQEQKSQEVLSSEYAAIFADDSLSDESNVVSEEKEEENVQDNKMTPEIIPNVSFEEEIEENQDGAQDLITVRPVKFQQFQDSAPNRAIKKNLDIMQDVSMHISVELGRTKSSIKEVMEFEAGSVVELDKIAGEQVEIFVNEKLVAKGEVIVIEDKFGVRVTSTNV